MKTRVALVGDQIAVAALRKVVFSCVRDFLKPVRVFRFYYYINFPLGTALHGLS